MSDRSGPYIVTGSGRKFWPLDPRPGDFAAKDIARALGNICRWGGHTSRPYTVAEHSLHVEAIACHLAGVERSFEISMWALLHDAAEAYIGDIVRPLKATAMYDHYRLHEQKIMVALAAQFRLPSEMPAVVKEADDLALQIEAEELITNGCDLVPELLNRGDELFSVPDDLRTLANIRWAPGEIAKAWLNRLMTVATYWVKL